MAWPMYVVILAGGGGTRLWPLSRPERPKPYLPLIGEESLLQRTVRRIAPLVGEDDIFCVTDRRFGQLVRAANHASTGERIEKGDRAAAFFFQLFRHFRNCVAQRSCRFGCSRETLSRILRQ